MYIEATAWPRWMARLCYVLIFWITSACGQLAQVDNWPVVAPFSSTKTFVDAGKDGADTPLIVTIKDTDGNPVYRLECHNGNYEDTSGMNFSGDFHCALFAIHGDMRATSNLLASTAAEEQGSDWMNRGRMTSNQLRDQCALYPDFGALREFRLRGMLLTFRYSDLLWVGDQLAQFTFNVSVVPDTSASSSTAAETSTLKPPTACY